MNPARVVNRLAVFILAACFAAPVCAIFGGLLQILTIDQSAFLLAFYVGNAPVFAPSILCAFIAWAATDRAAE